MNGLSAKSSSDANAVCSASHSYTNRFTEETIMDRKVLATRKNELLDRQTAILNAAQEGKRSLTQVENEEIANHTAAIADISNQIKLVDGITAEKALLAAPTSTPAVGNSTKTGKFTAEYHEQFYKNFGQLGRVQNNMLFEGADADSSNGGVVAPVIYEGQILPLVPNDIALRQLATVAQTANDMKIPCQVIRSAAATKAQSTTGGSHDFSATNPTVVLKNLTATMLGNYVPCSLESLADIGYLQSFVQSDISRAVLEAEEAAFTTVLVDPTNGATVYSGSSVTIAAPASFLDIVGNIKTAYDAASSWLMPRRTGIALLKAQVSANQFNPFWARQGNRDYFHGYPVFYTSALENLGSPAADNVVFGDFGRGMIIGDRNNSSVLVKVDDITNFKSGIINIFGYRRSGALVRDQHALRSYAL